MIGVQSAPLSIETKPWLEVQPASPDDAPEIAGVLRACAPDTVVMSEAEIRRQWWRYSVVRARGCGVVATVALHDVDRRTSELRSLAVDPHWRGHGLGAQLVERVLEQARERRRAILCVTLRPRFFARFGFRAVPLELVADRPGRTRRPGRPTRVNGRPRVAMVWRP